MQVAQLHADGVESLFPDHRSKLYDPHLILHQLHILLLPAAKIANVYSSWYLEIHLEYSIWSFGVTVPFTLYMFMTARTDLPPEYHFVSGVKQ